MNSTAQHLTADIRAPQSARKLFDAWIRTWRAPWDWSAEALLTPLPEALVEIERRKNDPVLQKKVEEYLNHDIPPYFKDAPVLYLARHVATPNFETLRFLHLLEPLGLRTVIGQDLKDKFVPKNMLKKALGRLHVTTGITKHGSEFKEHFENVRVVDFNTSSGKTFGDIKTVWGESLADFHNNLFAQITGVRTEIVDDSEWIDRHHRGQLVPHYRKFLALFILHGVLFEDYSLDDKEERKFIRTVLKPAYKYVERKFGCKPLIATLTPTSIESPDYWVSYPNKVLAIIKKKKGEEVLKPKKVTKSSLRQRLMRKGASILKL